MKVRDVCLKFSGVDYWLSGAVLAELSPVFESVFFGKCEGMVEGQMKTFEIKEPQIERKNVEDFIRFVLYREELDSGSTKVIGKLDKLLVIADLYQIQHLRKVCLKTMKTCLVESCSMKKMVLDLLVLLGKHKIGENGEKEERAIWERLFRKVLLLKLTPADFIGVKDLFPKSFYCSILEGFAIRMEQGGKDSRCPKGHRLLGVCLHSRCRFGPAKLRKDRPKAKKDIPGQCELCDKPWDRCTCVPASWDSPCPLS